MNIIVRFSYNIKEEDYSDFSGDDDDDDESDFELCYYRRLNYTNPLKNDIRNCLKLKSVKDFINKKFCVSVNNIKVEKVCKINEIGCYDSSIRYFIEDLNKVSRFEFYNHIYYDFYEINEDYRYLLEPFIQHGIKIKKKKIDFLKYLNNNK